MRAPRRHRALAAALLCALGSPAAGQEFRPGDERPPLPEPERPGEEEPHVLPPLPAPGPGEGLASGLRVRVERFEFVGSTVFRDAELQAAVAPFAGRAITSEELVAASDAVTSPYVDAGYVTSGAFVPDQRVADGVVRIEVVEGALGEVEVRGLRRFRSHHFHSRLAQAVRAPLRVQQVVEVLRRFQRDPLIERVDAALEPGTQRGESRLVLAVREGAPYRATFDAANDTSPAVGSAGGGLEAAFFNFTGLRDGVSVRAQFTEGLRDLDVGVSMPVTPWDTGLRLWWRRLDVEIVESPFDDLDVESELETWGAELRQPLYRRGPDEVWLGLSGEMRDLRTEILGLSFCSEPDPGLSETLRSCGGSATVVRTSLSWTRRTRQDVVALRSLLSVGVDAFGADIEDDDDLADGRFVAWLAQAQWAHVLPAWTLDSHLLLRADLQLSDDPLFSYERFALGGRTTVRGYRENAIVADNGVVASGEVRVPVWRDAFGNHRLEVVPFVDVGHAWTTGDEPLEDDTLFSAGLGLRLRPVDWMLAEAYWGAELAEVRDPNRVPQDYGFHLGLRVDVP